MSTGVLNVLRVNQGLIYEQVEESCLVSRVKMSIVVIIIMIMIIIIIMIIIMNNNNIIGKSKIHPRTGHEGPEVE